MKLPGPVDHGD